MKIFVNHIETNTVYKCCDKKTLIIIVMVSRLILTFSHYSNIFLVSYFSFNIILYV